MGGVKEEDQQVADVALRKEASETCKEQKVLYKAEYMGVTKASMINKDSKRLRNIVNGYCISYI